MRLVCPFHADEDLEGSPVGSADGALEFACPRGGHPEPGPHTWLHVPVDDSLAEEMSGLAGELGLREELPAALKQYSGTWVEYGVLERAYALAKPGDFGELVRRYGHTAITAKRYTASAFLGRALGDLSSWGILEFHSGPATGRWRYNSTISWWALPPAPAWDSNRLSWEELGASMDYVPGSNEP